jgi:hypothetical protein
MAKKIRKRWNKSYHRNKKKEKGNNHPIQGSFRVCEKCGKKLIQRLPNGMWSFQFGRRKDLNEDGVCDPYFPVEMYISGSVKIRCFSKICNHWNEFHYFPNFKHVGTQSPVAKDIQKQDLVQQKVITNPNPEGKEVIQNGA